MISQNIIENLSNLPGATRRKLNLTPGDDNPDSLWLDIVNARLEVDGQYVFWKTRGGSTLVNGFFGNVITVKAIQAELNGVITDYIVVHTAGGKVYLWNIALAQSNEIVSGGFSTTEQIQIINIGRFVFMFDYDGGQKKYYDLSKDVSFDYMDYNRALIHTTNTRSGDIKEDVDNIFNFKISSDIIVFPNIDKGLGDEVFSSAGFSDGDSESLDPSIFKENSFFYTYNSGKFLKDNDGNVYKRSQFITFAPGSNNFGFTVNGTGADFTINKYYIPLDNRGEPAYKSYKTTITNIKNGVIFWDDLAGVEQSVSPGTIAEEDINTNYSIFPYSPDLEDLIGRPATFTLNDEGTAVINTFDYVEPFIFRQYVAFDFLIDGSATLLGLPGQVKVGTKDIMSKGVIDVALTTTAPDNNIEKRFLCATRWQTTSDAAFNPSSETYSNSPLFIIGEFINSDIIIIDSTPDRKLIRAINEIIPVISGVTDLFNTQELKPNSVAQFSGAIMHGGYTVDRNIPNVYTNASVAGKGNIYINFTQTQQLVNNMAVAFMFEYADGKKSNVLETEHFLQQEGVQQTGTNICGQVKATASHTITAGAGTDDTLTITYDGYVLNIPLTTVSHSTAGAVAEAIRSFVEADPDIQLSAVVENTTTVVYTEERWGDEFNGEIIDVNPAATGVTFDTEDPVLSSGVEPEGTGSIVYLTQIDNILQSGEQGQGQLTIDGVMSNTWLVDEGEFLSSVFNKIVDAVNNSSLASDWTATLDFDIQEFGGANGVKIESNVKGDVSFDDLEAKVVYSSDLSYQIAGKDLVPTSSVSFTNGATTACLNSTASLDVTSNGLAASTTEDHVITIDGEDTPAITILDTDTTEQIVDKYITEIANQEQIDRFWKATKTDQGGGTWRLVLTYRERGEQFNGKEVTITGNTDVAVTVNSPSAGGTGGGQEEETFNPNQLQIHSLNTLISRVHVLLRKTATPENTFHPFASYNITAPECHGKPIELPATTEDANQVEANLFTLPPANEILESVELSNYVNVGIPAQQFNISTQEEIADNSKIKKVVPLDFDQDRTVMRFRVAVFTDQNIQTGFLVDQTVNGNRIFTGDFQVSFDQLIARSREGVSNINGRIFWDTNFGIYIWAGQGTPQKLFDRRRYSASSNKLKDVVYNERYNEFWLFFADNDVLVVDEETLLTRRMDYSGLGTVYTGTYLKDKFYIGSDTNLMITDDHAVTDDNGAAFSGQASTKHIGSETEQVRLIDLTVGGQQFQVTADTDYQAERFIGNSDVWDKQFTSDLTVGPKTLAIHGKVFSIHRYAVMPRIKITFPATTGGFISHIILKYIPTLNIGEARE